jgi:PAS domain S-box-containing protein
VDSIQRSDYAKLMNAAPDPVFLVDTNGVIVFANRQAEHVFGYDESELLGKPVEVLLPEAIRTAHQDYRHAFFTSPKTRPMGLGLDLWGQVKSGSALPVEISLSPVELNGRSYALAIVRDATESRRVQRQMQRQAEALKRSNEELEQFAYVASHDLQEPLRMISSYIQILQKRYQAKLDSDANEFIQFAVDGARRMQNLINDLLMYSRVTSKARPLKATDMNLVVRQIQSNLAVAIEESGAQIEAEEMPAIVTDEVQMIQLLQNLVANALKFRSESRPLIKISAERQFDGVVFSVKDNGIGIDPRYFDRIFIVFQRLHTREKYPGTGIGLAICKKIVDRQGGKIWVESQPGNGAEFKFLIPNRSECDEA